MSGAIGVFDSGLGGLTAVKELVKILPHEDIIYFGDTSRVPYGTRSRDTIISYAKQDLNFLSTFNIKAALVACGTISAVALDTLKGDYNFDITGVIESAANAAVSATVNKKIGIIGTNATIKSGAYEKALAGICPDIKTVAVPCPLFVPLVENGHIREDDPITALAVEHYIKTIVDFGADTIILGCTHYPLIAHAIGKYVGEDVKLINPGREAAKTLKQKLERDGLLSENGGTHRYYVSDSIENFESLGSLFMKQSISGEVHKIDIEKY